MSSLRLQNKERDEIVGESQDHPGLLTCTDTSHIRQGIKEMTIIMLISLSIVSLVIPLPSQSQQLLPSRH